jgi:hypothetical protein
MMEPLMLSAAWVHGLGYGLHRMTAVVVTVCLCGALGTATWSEAADDRRVWEYTGEFGPSWFVQEKKPKWVIYRGDGQTFLYLEERRTDEAIELRGPYTGLQIRLGADRFETRRAPDQPWRRSAGGRWVGEDRLPQRIRQAPPGCQTRLVYFVAADREPVPGHAPKIRQIMSLIAEVLHDELRAKGHRPRRLEFESADGEAVVHLVRGTRPAAYYHANWDTDPQAQMTRIHDELLKSFGDPDRHLTVVFSETYEPGPAKEAWAGHIARGIAKPPEGGLAVYSSWILKDEFSSANRDAQLKLFFDQTPIQGRKAFGSRLANSPRYEFVEDAFGAVVHELGHALGLPHDYRSPRDLMGSGFRELRWNFDPKSSSNRKAGFSADNARMLMSSRYLADDLNLDDFDPPHVELELTRRGRALTATIKANDDGGLRTLLLYDRTKEPSSVVGGSALSGTEQTIVERLPAETLAPALAPKIEAFVADRGGNVTRVTRSLTGEK